MDDEELWKEWPQDPRIKVSNKGNVIGCKSGVWRPYKVVYNNHGYQMVGASRPMPYVHRMVAETWLDNPNNYRDVNHINGVKDDNRVENLEWVTHSQNLSHAYRTGLHSKANPIRIVETDEVFDSIRECARQIGCAPSNISECLAGRQLTCHGYHFEYA